MKFKWYQIKDVNLLKQNAENNEESEFLFCIKKKFETENEAKQFAKKRNLQCYLCATCSKWHCYSGKKLNFSNDYGARKKSF